MNNSRNIADPDVRMLTDIAASLYADYEDDDLSWAGSPFGLDQSRPSRQRGKIGEQLVSGFFAAKNFHGGTLSQAVRILRRFSP